MGHDERVAIIGLGYVGLPLAISFVEAGLTVVGVDASAARVAELRGGTSPIDDISDDRLRAALGDGPPGRPARGGRSRPMPTRSSSASRRRSPTSKDPGPRAGPERGAS